MIGYWDTWVAEGWELAVATAVLHFLWQGLLIGLIVVALDRCFRTLSAGLRYALYTTAMASLPVCFLGTLCALQIPDAWENASTSSSTSSQTIAPDVLASDSDSPSVEPYASAALDAFREARNQGQEQRTVPDAAKQASFSNGKSSEQQSGQQILTEPNQIRLWPEKLAPLLAWAYLLGVGVFLVRLLLAVWGGHRLRKASQAVEDPGLLDLVAIQARQVGLRMVPAIAFCERVAVPTVVGVLRPMVLLPTSLVAGLDAEHLSAIISHELSHIRRFDLLTNILQRLIESFFFFHPVVWFLSRQVSNARENCCDDLVVSSGYDPMFYAGALLRMAELSNSVSHPASAVSAAAVGSSVTQFELRVKRLMQMSGPTHLRLTRGGVLLFSLLCIAVLLLPLAVRPPTVLGTTQLEDAPMTQAVSGTLQFQMAVRRGKAKPVDDVNSGDWQVAVEWMLPIRSKGGPGTVYSEVDGARVRISWDSVRNTQGGIQFEGFQWEIENPIDRRDGVSHGGIGGQQLTPGKKTFGNEFDWLASLELDTATQLKSRRTLVFRAKFVEGRQNLKRLNLSELTGRQSREVSSKTNGTDAYSSETAGQATEQGQVSLFELAFESDPTFGKDSSRHMGQLECIKNWQVALEREELSRERRVFAWWRIGALAASNFDISAGESADMELAAKAFGRVLSLGNDLICRETLNAATQYTTLGGSFEKRAMRLELGGQWLGTRTAFMLTQSASRVNSHGYALDDRLMLGGMNLKSETEKLEFLQRQLTDALDGLEARFVTPGSYNLRHALSRLLVENSTIPPGQTSEFARDEVRQILSEGWATEDCRMMGEAFLDAWQQVISGAPQHVRNELSFCIASRMLRFRKVLAQYKESEIKNCVAAQVFHSATHQLLLLAGAPWPSEVEIDHNLTAQEGLLRHFASQLASSSSSIPMWASEILLTSAKDICSSARLQLFRRTGYIALADEDLMQIQAMLENSRVASQQYFDDREPFADAAAKQFLRQVCRGQESILLYLEFAIPEDEQNSIARSFLAKHRETMAAIELRLMEWDRQGVNLDNWMPTEKRIVGRKRESVDQPAEQRDGNGTQPAFGPGKNLNNTREQVPTPNVSAIPQANGDDANSGSLELDRKLVQRLRDAVGTPVWKLEHIDKQPSIHIEGLQGYRILLRRTWKEYTSPPQRAETPREDWGPFVEKHEDWEFVLFSRDALEHATGAADSLKVAAQGKPGKGSEDGTKRGVNGSPSVLKSKIPWRVIASPYHTQAVYLGQGMGFAWFTKGTIFGQESVRDNLNLSGGEDRIALLVSGMQVNDEGSNTANACQRLISKFDDQALGPILLAVRQTRDPSSLRKLVASLAFIPTDAATAVLVQLHDWESRAVRESAERALAYRPFRAAAKSVYLDMLRERRHVDAACEACVQFEWSEATEILDQLIASPSSLRELSWTIPTRRRLQGNPISPELIEAKRVILLGKTDPDNFQDNLQRLLHSTDSEAIVLIGIELATYTTKGPQSRVNETGIRLLQSLPQTKVVRFLQGVSPAMPASEAAKVNRLLQQVLQPGNKH